MAYKMAATAVTLNDLEVHSPVAGFFKCNQSINQSVRPYQVNLGRIQRSNV